MTARQCFCCEQTWNMPTGAADWHQHIRTDEYAARIRTPEARERISAYWKAKDLEQTGLLF